MKTKGEREAMYHITSVCSKVFAVLILAGLLLLAVGGVDSWAARVKDIAEGEGDLTARIEISSKDEIGALAASFNRFIEKLQLMVKDIAGNAETLNASSGNLSGLSGHMSTGAQGMYEKSNTVAAAAEQMSANINSVAAAMEQASTNVSMVASSAEQMSATIHEIVNNIPAVRTSCYRR